MTVSDFLSALERATGHAPKPEKPGQWMARCPAHDDKQASLAVGVGDDGRVLLKCFAGCEPDAIMTSLGLQKRDLFAGKPSDVGPGGRRIVAVYDYVDSSGKLLYQVVRLYPKDFRQRRPDGAGGWIWNLDGIEKRPLYRLPGILATGKETANG